MPSPLVAALAAPIREVQSMVGPGSDEAASVLAGVRAALADVSAAARAAWQHAGVQWTGTGADGAAGFSAATVAAADALAARADHLGVRTGTAAQAVARASQRLRVIADRFEARAAALEPHLDEPGTAEELIAEAQRALTEAIAVVDELKGELDGQAATLSGQPSAPVPTAPAGFSGGGMPGSGSGLGGSAPMSPMSPMTGMGGGPGDLSAFAPAEHEAAEALVNPRTFGDGVAVRLPDGTTVMAPNAVAASAVRHALTQLGVPYQWGGTTPGAGLDCSGLTQWAYREAGLDIPRLAQEQDVGAAVDPGSLRPGDLAVWDGHVAMVVGNGMMIEAGDPVKLSPIRTDNAGQGFQGFWRPTA
jgi:peptidoglycan DL-endopeptidase CwlO